LDPVPARTEFCLCRVCRDYTRRSAKPGVLFLYYDPDRPSPTDSEIRLRLYPLTSFEAWWDRP